MVVKTLNNICYWSIVSLITSCNNFTSHSFFTSSHIFDQTINIHICSSHLYMLMHLAPCHLFLIYLDN